jgi:hypothetical protein
MKCDVNVICYGRPLACAADQVVTTVNNQQECQCQNDDAMFHRVIWPKDRKCYSLNTKVLNSFDYI